MDAVREQLNQPLQAAIAGFVVGAIIGLVLLGWWLFPVQWTDAAPTHLRGDLQQDYLQMAIDSYSLNQDGQQARTRFEALGEAGPTLLADLASSPGAQAARISEFTAAVGAAPGVAEPAEPAAEAGGVRSPLLIMCGVTAVLAVGLALVFFLRRQTESPAGGVGGVEAVPGIPAGEELAEGEEPALAQFMTTYMLGDDLFDDSFSVDSPAGEFLGECGVGIAETIGVGEPKRVSAFELWLFDKNDIQTVTKVLMSAHAYQDEATRQRLAAKGEPVLAEPGSQVTLETATLQLVARVVDMSYGEGAMPSESFMDRITIEMAVWKKI